MKNLLLLLLLAGASFAWEENSSAGWAGVFDGAANLSGEVALAYEPSGLGSYWGFEEGSGAAAYDNTGANNATLYNSPAWTSGKFGGGLLFDGINDYADAGNGASLNVANALTIEAWAYPASNASLGNVRAIMDKFGTSPNFTTASAWSVYDTTAVNANSKGFYGAVFDGRYVYFVQNENVVPSGQVTRYDTTGSFTSAGSWSVYDTTAVNANSKGFFGAVFDGRYIYFVPFYNGVFSGQITRYDTTGSFTSASSWSVYDTTAVNANSKGFYGAVFDGRYVYFVPYYNGVSHGQVTRYDTTGSFTSAGSWSVYDTTAVNANSKGFSGGVFDGRYVYFIPFSTGVYHGQVTRYDSTGSFTSAGSWSVYDTTAVNANSKGFSGAVFDGRYIYFPPNSNGAYYGQVTRYDTTGSFTSAGSWSVYDTTAVNANSKGFYGAVFDGRYVYFVPHYNGGYHGQVTRYDSTGSFTSAGSWSVYDTTAVNANSKGFAGAVFDGRYMYFVPYYHGGYHGQVTRYDTTGSNASYSLLYGLGQNSWGSTPFGAGVRINTANGIYSVFDNRMQTGWHHFAGVYNGSSLSLYTDGSLAGAVNASGAILASSSSLTIGSVLNSFFNGTVDEARIYNRSLTPTEINASMNGQVRFTNSNYTTQSLDAGAGSMWRNLTVVFNDGGANTTMDLYAAVNNDNATWSYALVQANAANNTLYSLPTSGRYLKIRVNEKTNDGAYTDRLQKITALSGIADTIPPAISMISPTSTTYATGTISVNYTATDNVAVASCTARLNGTINSSTCNNYTLTLSNGAYTLNITANDTSGNANSSQASFTVAITSGPQSNSTTATTDASGIAAANVSFSFTPGTLRINTGAQEQTKTIRASAGVNRIGLKAKITLSGQAVSGKQVAYTVSE